MLPQRARVAENRVKNRLSNGPRRAQSNVLRNTEYSATCRHTSVVRDMMVSCKACSCQSCKPRWHRGLCMYSSLAECRFCQGRFLFHKIQENLPMSTARRGDMAMKYLPDLKTVTSIAATGKYNILPVSCEILSDICTPIEAMKILKNVSTHCFLLESVSGNERWGRYTFLGFDPKMEITCLDGEMTLGNIKIKTDDPSVYLRQIYQIIKVPVLIICHLSPADWWDISHMII